MPKDVLKGLGLGADPGLLGKMISHSAGLGMPRCTPRKVGGGEWGQGGLRTSAQTVAL